MSERDEAIEVIKLLAGAAQAGAKGQVAIAALEVMEASGRVQAVKMLDKGPDAEDAAMLELKLAQEKLAELMNQPDLLAEAKRDLSIGNGRSYEC